MPPFRTLSTLLLVAALTGTALAAGPKLTCGQASKCPAGILASYRRYGNPRTSGFGGYDNFGP